MESLTKNRQSRETIGEMVKRFFGSDGLKEYTELTEGYFNVAYEIELQSGKKTILKVAPSQDVVIMSYERNIMFSEVESMKIASRNPRIPVAEIYGYDDSCSICPSPYFFMEKLEGCSLHSMKEELSEGKLQGLQMETGAINKIINDITCPVFGFPGQPEYQGKDWYSVFSRMMKLGVDDAAARNINLNISVEKLWDWLERDREIFEEVREPRLVHWDLWDGNVFIKDGKVSGIIDWERCLWADPLLEVGFRTYGNSQYFKKGYGCETMTEAQERRTLWYDVYVLVLVSLECEYRRYETMEMYQWGNGLLVKQFAKLSG